MLKFIINQYWGGTTMNRLFGRSKVNDLRSAAPPGPVKVINARTGELLRYEPPTLRLSERTLSRMKKGYQK